MARPGIEPRTSDLRVSCPTDCAMQSGKGRGWGVGGVSDFWFLLFFFSKESKSEKNIFFLFSLKGVKVREDWLV